MSQAYYSVSVQQNLFQVEFIHSLFQNKISGLGQAFKPACLQQDRSKSFLTQVKRVDFSLFQSLRPGCLVKINQYQVSGTE